MMSPLDQLISISFFNNVTSTHANVQNISLRSLDSHVLKIHKTSTASLKEARRDLPMFKLGTFDGTRSAINLASITGIEGDVDNCKDLSWSVARLIDARVFAYIYTTSSNSNECARYRILCPCSRTLDPDRWQGLHSKLDRVLGHNLDPAAAQPAQAYFIGCLEGLLPPDIIHVDPPNGRCIDELTDYDAPHINSDASVLEAIIEDDDPFSHIQFRRESSADTIKAMLAVIPPDQREIWIEVGMILKEVLGEDGLELWDDWSAGSAKYGGIGTAWKSFGRKAGGRKLGIGSLYKLANQHGYEEQEIDPDILELNERHAVVMVRGKALVTTRLGDGALSIGQLRDLHQMYANRLVPASRNRSEPVSRKWERHPKRRTFWKGLTFSPGIDEPGKFNFWEGWPVLPDANASCTLFLQHVGDVICAGDRDSAEYVLGWLAHLVQRPWEKPDVAIIVGGGKGAGKDTFADYVIAMVGRQYAPSVSQPSHVTGKFNARLESALLLHVQEGFWGGDVQAEQVLKYLITSPFIEIERKGIDTYTICSCLRLIISGNAAWMVPASVDERRFAVFEASNDRCGDTEYFSALRHEMEGNGPAALMHFLTSYDISKFDVRKSPRTEGLIRQKLESLRGIQAWWLALLSSGEIISDSGADPDYWMNSPLRISKQTLRKLYADYVKGRRFEGNPVTQERFTSEFRKMLPQLSEERPRNEGRRERNYVLPPLSECRESFCNFIGGKVSWSD